jgi:hypothetical protein
MIREVSRPSDDDIQKSEKLDNTDALALFNIIKLDLLFPLMYYILHKIIVAYKYVNILFVKTL